MVLILALLRLGPQAAAIGAAGRYTLGTVRSTAIATMNLVWQGIGWNGEQRVGSY